MAVFESWNYAGNTAVLRVVTSMQDNIHVCADNSKSVLALDKCSLERRWCRVSVVEEASGCELGIDLLSHISYEHIHAPSLGCYCLCVYKKC